MTVLKSYSLVSLKSFAIVLLMAFASCKKDKIDTVVPPTSPMVGTWVGALTTNGAPVGSLYIAVKQNGILEAQNASGQKIADGTWELGGSAGSTFNCTYTTNYGTPQKYNLIGTLDAPTKMTGAFGTGSSKVNGGFWYLNKK
jgi:hypothetical protein